MERRELLDGILSRSHASESLVTEEVSRKDAVHSYFQNKGIDFRKAETKMHDTIIHVFTTYQGKITKSADQYKFPENFFEMSRLDFVFDEGLNVYLMEANLSPMLANDHHKQHIALYERLVYSLLSLNGLSTPSVLNKLNASESMETHNVDVHVYPQECQSPKCSMRCEDLTCKFCKSCLNTKQDQQLKHAFNEHVNRRGFRRIFPQTFSSQYQAEKWNYTGDKDFLSLTQDNQWMTMWFRGKCLQDTTWCS